MAVAITLSAVKKSTEVQPQRNSSNNNIPYAATSEETIYLTPRFLHVIGNTNSTHLKFSCNIHVVIVIVSYNTDLLNEMYG